MSNNLQRTSLLYALLFANAISPQTTFFTSQKSPRTPCQLRSPTLRVWFLHLPGCPADEGAGYPPGN